MAIQVRRHHATRANVGFKLPCRQAENVAGRCRAQGGQPAALFTPQRRRASINAGLRLIYLLGGYSRVTGRYENPAECRILAETGLISI
ncbi:hypothetical protein BCY88_12940 [Paraburkholderia fungorum]|uniref:Uncharacterized protein n=1 Tax=Paraburkholderia fungorum TaxID=134537 RepID=A0A3R7E1Q4_9BURK|nr:hypothetical protein BCY88_12940 [Paraburkholderia fungorum]